MTCIYEWDLYVQSKAGGFDVRCAMGVQCISCSWVVLLLSPRVQSDELCPYPSKKDEDPGLWAISSRRSPAVIPSSIIRSSVCASASISFWVPSFLSFVYSQFCANFHHNHIVRSSNCHVTALEIRNAYTLPSQDVAPYGDDGRDDPYGQQQ